MSAARTRIARCALPVAAIACLASALGPVLWGSATAGVYLLASGAAAAGLTILAARRSRELRDSAVAALDRAAGLDGSLRSAHWFAVHSPSDPAGASNASWVGHHIDEALARAAGVDWARVYQGPSSRLPWVLTAACTLATLGLSARPLPRWPSRPIQVAETAPAAAPSNTPSATGFLVPQVVEGIRVMSSGRTPSDEQLTAIGRALDAAKEDPVARKRIESEVSASDASRATPQPWSEGDLDSGGWSDDYDSGFEIADLEWAYQEALARARMDERPHPDPGSEAVSPEGTGNGTSPPRQGEPAAGGALTGAPVEADTRGQAVNFTSLLLGRQQASGAAVPLDQAQDHGRAARLSAALRNEVVHARNDVIDREPGAPTARRATNAGQTPAGSAARPAQVRYDRSRATQPPAVPEARRSLVHDFFLRPAAAGTAVKQP